MDKFKSLRIDDASVLMRLWELNVWFGVSTKWIVDMIIETANDVSVILCTGALNDPVMHCWFKLYREHYKCLFVALQCDRSNSWTCWRWKLSHIGSVWSKQRWWDVSCTDTCQHNFYVSCSRCCQICHTLILINSYSFSCCSVLYYHLCNWKLLLWQYTTVCIITLLFITVTHFSEM